MVGFEGSFQLGHFLPYHQLQLGPLQSKLGLHLEAARSSHPPSCAWEKSTPPPVCLDPAGSHLPDSFLFQSVISSAHFCLQITEFASSATPAAGTRPECNPWLALLWPLPHLLGPSPHSPPHPAARRSCLKAGLLCRSPCTAPHGQHDIQVFPAWSLMVPRAPPHPQTLPDHLNSALSYLCALLMMLCPFGIPFCLLLPLANSYAPFKALPKPTTS